MDFKTICVDFFTLPQSEFVAKVADFILAQYAANARAEEPCIHPDDTDRDVAVVHAFVAATATHPELFDNWLVFALYNCKNVPRELLIRDNVDSLTAMTPLTLSLLPAATVRRAPHIAALKEQLQAICAANQAAPTK